MGYYAFKSILKNGIPLDDRGKQNAPYFENSEICEI